MGKFVGGAPVRRRRRRVRWRCPATTDSFPTAPRSAANGSAAAVNPLLTPVTVGPYELQHRVVLAPLTRCRAFGTIPQPLAATYYSQRATAGGLMISEGTVVSERGHGYPCTPGINRPEQVEAWKPIVQAVHDKGAVFFCQLWHVGRASHPHYQPNEELPIAPSAIAINDGNKVFSLKTMQVGGGVWRGGGGEGDEWALSAPRSHACLDWLPQMEDYPVPRALELAEIPTIVDEFCVGARNAIDAGGCTSHRAPHVAQPCTPPCHTHTQQHAP